MALKNSNFQFWTGIFLLALLVFSIYSQAVHGEWLWDDDELVSANRVLRNVSGLKDIWFNPASTQQYYPLTFTAFWLQYQIWGLNTAGYHLVNIFLHLLNAILVWQVFRLLGVKGAYLIALLFAVHPVCVETVAWISELKNLLSGFFYLLALLCYLAYDGVSSMDDKFCGKKLFYILALLFFVFALLSKTTAATLSVVIVLLSWWKRGNIVRKDFVKAIPFFFAGILAGSITVWCEKVFVAARGEFWQYTFAERLIIAGRALWFYPSKIIWPVNLSFFYELWPVNSHDVISYGYILSFGVLLLALFVLRHRIGRGPFTAVSFYVITIFPALGFFNIETMRYSFVADHYQYLASLGWMSLILSGSYTVVSCKKGICLPVVKIIFVSLISFLAGVSYLQSSIYQTQMALYKDVISKNPKSWLAYINLGSVYNRQGRYEAAIPKINKAIEIYPEFYLGYRYRAIVNLNMKKYAEAISDATRAIKIKPFAEAFELRGLIYFNQGLMEKALNDYNTCLSIDPNFLQGLVVRGQIYTDLKMNDLALQDLAKVLAREPQYCYGYQLRSQIYLRQGDMFKATQEKSRAERFGCILKNIP